MYLTYTFIEVGLEDLKKTGNKRSSDYLELNSLRVRNLDSFLLIEWLKKEFVVLLNRQKRHR